MKKAMVYALVVVMALVGSYMGIKNDIDYQRRMKIETQSFLVETAANMLGMEYIGIIDGSEISQRSGCIYDGPAIYAELLRRAGQDEDSDAWSFAFASYGRISVRKLTIYEDGQDDIPVFDRKVKCEFLYGII